MNNVMHCENNGIVSTALSGLNCQLVDLYSVEYDALPITLQKHKMEQV